MIIVISLIVLSGAIALFWREKFASFTHNIPANISEISQESENEFGDLKEEKLESEEPEEELEEMTEPGGQNETDWQWAGKQKKLYELTSSETDSILKELWERFPDQDERLKALAILRLGTPYQLDCLGEESGRDKDPIFRLDVTDCTTFILTAAALLHSQNLEEAKGMMKFLNYQPNSEMTFENRLHFTTDRNAVSPYFEDITGRFLCGCSLKTVKVTLNKVKPDGRRLIDINWEKETTIRYIPGQYITEKLFSKLPAAIGVAFFKNGDEKIGLDVRHEGFLFDGQLLFHATSAQEVVAAEDFFEYYFGKDGKTPKFDGIILFEIK